LTQLSPAHREIIDLVYYHEKSIGEVAEIIGVPQNTAKTRSYRRDADLFVDNAAPRPPLSTARAAIEREGPALSSSVKCLGSDNLARC